jgi:hypothetical protein
MRHKLSGLLLLLGMWLLALTSGCAPKLGDGCKTSTDCSIRGDRICDRAQPGGYCTIAACTKGSCGDEGVCVRFRPNEDRLSTNYCMAKCDSTGDCDRDNYVCRSADDLNEQSAEGEFARVLDGSGNQKFCTAKE